MELAKTPALAIVCFTSLAVLVYPTFLDEIWAYLLRVIGTPLPFVRAPLLSPTLDNPYYVLVEFSLALTSLVIFGVEYHQQFVGIDLIQSWTLRVQVVAIALSFIAFEGPFFLAVSTETSEKDLGYFGSLHRALWVPVRRLGSGVIMIFRVAFAILTVVQNVLEGCKRGLKFDECLHSVRRPRESSEELREEDLELGPSPYYDNLRSDYAVHRDVEKG